MDLLLLVILLGLSASFSGAETAFFSLRRADLAKLTREHGASGAHVVALVKRSRDLLSALLVGNLLVNTAASVVATGLILDRVGARGVAVAIPVITLVLLLVGEITPKMIALGTRRRTSLLAQAPLRLWVTVNRPLLRLIGALVEGILGLLPWPRTGAQPLTVSELQTACDLAVEEGTLTDTEGRSLARLLQLEELEVLHIMTPRTEVVTLRRDLSLKQILATARRAGYNRYPVLEPGGDRPVGLFHLKDLLGMTGQGDRPLAGLLRPMLFVPESKDVAALLVEMRGGSTHLVAVVDEHGDFTGIVTMADCLLALMGPVADIGGQDPDVIPLGDGRWLISGGCDLREFEEACGIPLPPSRDYVTVAGYMMKALGRVLKPGDRVTLPQGRLTVLEMAGHRVERIKVTRILESGRRGDPGGGS
ncbi:MAG: hemolysin family protein [Candidatus Krumholzibacteriia bacterium]